ncbi:MAG: bifunctional [glutamine synthetase] adenylyltransferase/[glutamine synthetase]-adenylyl-L-tyrosine phosphorylase [Actinomycetota bacterium]|nr:bifunctional [glutamine synthetase] adenylyltransferase/[glutamine synthetase]-adenylyl-L-tyrosine phosphorylase [Actinomycetota bacterium]
MGPGGSKRERPAALRAGSKTLGELLDKDERALALVESEAPVLERDGYADAMRTAHTLGGMPEVRREKRRRLAAIAALDFAGDASLETVGVALADLADACLGVALQEVGAPDGMAVIAMGKLGGTELNYASDIDVMFLVDAKPLDAVKAAERLLQELGASGPEGQAYRIDTSLRPEGRSGALVRSLDGYIEYYDRWAKPWEYQALIKARCAAGNESVGTELIDALRRSVFPVQAGKERIADIRRMKERVEDHAVRSARRSKISEVDDVKLGPGGIRDIEFSVQLLQLVHGGTDPSVRSRPTLQALQALVKGGYVAEEDGAALQVGYRWLRTVEHRLQLWQERQVHHLPRANGARVRLARGLGFKDTPATSAVSGFEAAHRGVLADTRARFDKLFYRPMIDSLVDTSTPRLSEEALMDRLRVLGFRDVDRASKTLHELVSGTSRRAKLFRVLSPSFLQSVASAPLPDVGLFSFLRLGEAMGDRIESLGALRDNPPAIAMLAGVLGSGRLLGDILRQAPEELAVTAAPQGPPLPKGRDRLVLDAAASLEWREAGKKLDGLRRFKRREMFRIAVADITGAIGVEETGAALSDLAEACLEAALDRSGGRFAIVGMGKLGGRELNYSSDVDVMFVHDTDPQVAEKTAVGLLRGIGEVTPEGQAFRIDPSIRPEGKAGPLVRSLPSFLEYYRRWAQPWERQALLKTRWVAGDHELGDEFVSAATELAYPERLEEQALREIRHLKARMEKERVARGADPRRDMKMGPGGASDIEFAAQVLQLRFGGSHPELRVTNTLETLRGARAGGVIAQEDATRLAEAYRFVARVRNRLFFIVGRPSDVLPAKPEDLEALGVALGYSLQPRQELEEDYRRLTRRARKVAERLIYG